MAAACSGPARQLEGRATVEFSYQPGESRVWHPGDDLHTVTVLAGTLTVSDPVARAETYAAGESFAAGWEVHITAKATEAEVRTEVRFLQPGGPGQTIS